MLKTSRFLGRSPAAFQLARSIVKVAPTEASVLIMGESGTGKEVVARVIHQRSARRNAPFIAVNCGAINPSLVESTLFGHEKGSFTGATSAASGYFELADTGTLFLDEITEMPLAMQVQLLRVLENGSYRRVGGTEQLNVNVRIIAATNRDPKEAVRAHAFRNDLLYRLAVFPLRVPPLRERAIDIDYLSQNFLNEFNRQEKTQKPFTAQTLTRLRAYHWPGNIRELKNAVMRAYILSDGEVDVAPPEATTASRLPDAVQGQVKIAIGTSLEAALHALTVATLKVYKGDRRRTAQALGISPKTLYNRLEQLRQPGRSPSSVTLADGP